MSIRFRRSCAALLAVNAAYVGVWALLAPESFFTNFPVPGHAWVTGTYDEHLTRDVGGLYLSLFVVSAWAVVRGRDDALRVAGVAWLAFAFPHTVFHLAHVDDLAGLDRWGNAVSVVAMTVLAVALVVPSRRSSADSRSGGSERHVRSEGAGARS